MFVISISKNIMAYKIFKSNLVTVKKYDLRKCKLVYI